MITEDNLVVEHRHRAVLPGHRPAGGRRTRSRTTSRRSSSSPSPRCATSIGSHGPGADADLPRQINSRLRGVLDEATGKWGIRVNRVEIKAIDPPKTHQGRDGEADARRAGQARRDPDAEGSAAVQDPHRRRRQAERDPDRRGRPAGRDPRGPKARPGPSTGLPGRPPQRPRPEAAGLPVPADAAAARQGRGQHVLGDPQRGHLRAPGRLQGLHRGPAPSAATREAGRSPRSARRPPGSRPRRRRPPPRRWRKPPRPTPASASSAPGPPPTPTLSPTCRRTATAPPPDPLPAVPMTDLRGSPGVSVLAVRTEAPGSSASGRSMPSTHSGGTSQNTGFERVTVTHAPGGDDISKRSGDTLPGGPGATGRHRI